MHCQFMVNKKQAILLEDFLKRENIPSKIVIPNVQKAIDAELRKNAKPSTYLTKNNVSRQWPFRKFDYSKFNRFDEVSNIA